MKRPVKRKTPIEVRAAAHADYQDRSWQASLQRDAQILALFEDREVPFRLHNKKNMHIIVQGAARTVNFYGTTGTVHAAGTAHSKEYWLRGASMVAGVERAIGLATLGH